MDFEKGLLCGLTNEYANFDIDCEYFDEDQEAKSSKLLRDLNASGHQKARKSLNPEDNKTTGALLFVVGILIFFITTSYFESLGVIAIPFGMILYGVRTYLKGIEQEKVLKKREDFDDKRNQTE